jgi:hypothetical protein
MVFGGGGEGYFWGEAESSFLPSSDPHSQEAIKKTFPLKSLSCQSFIISLLWT